jgi:hypothetical protein
LLILLFGASVLFAQTQEIDPRIFENQAPLTDKDIEAVITAMPKVNVDDLDEKKFTSIAKEVGLTPNRLNFAITKTTFGLIIELNPESKANLLDMVSPPDAIPTAAEQELFAKYREKLEEIF